VQHNLRSFLEQFDHSQWKSNRPVECWLWIDALCIDQTSTNEKNAQVALMGHIFQSAVCVSAWLGSEATEDTKRAISLEDLVQELSGQSISRLKDYMSVDHPKVASLSWASAYLGDTQSSYLIPWRQRIWGRFQLICDEDYWRRVWIRQEMWLAKDIKICRRRGSVA
jgi:hypothetical protein